jgi:hypothetical protein
VVDDLTLVAGAPTLLQWMRQLPVTGPAIHYDVLSGTLSDLRMLGLASATPCVACDAPGYGPNRSVLASISCTGP